MQALQTLSVEAPVAMRQVENRAQHLVVAAPRLEDAEVAAALLHAAGVKHIQEPTESVEQSTALVPQSYLGELDDVGAWLRKYAHSHLVLIVPEPVFFVAEALNAGILPTDALAAWSALASQGLALVRASGRRRSSVFFAEPLRAQPSEFLKKLGERLHQPLVYSPSADARNAKELPGAICRITAQNAIWQSSDARAQAVELTAIAVPLSYDDIDIVPPVDTVFEEYEKATSEAAKTHYLLNGEKTALEKRLEAAQSELDAARAKVEAAQSELKAKQELIDNGNRAPANLERVNQELQEENDLLLRQLHYVQEELESYYIRSTEAGPELTAAKATIDALVNSLSWRITRPLRVVLGALTGKKAGL